MSVICPDVSEFQTALTGGYPRDFLIFRGSFGATYQDRHFLANANAAAKLYAAGKIAGAIVYTVYLPGAVRSQYAFLWSLLGPTPPPWLAGVMVDVEHWGGTSYQINGDHSAELNTLYGLHAHRMGSWASCIGYGNKGDLAAIWPRRDVRCRVIQAAYGSKVALSVPGAIGQQYTDGQAKWGLPAGMPASTPPFGRCDHNVFPGFANAHALRASLRPVKPASPVLAAVKPAAGHYAAYPAGNVLVSAGKNTAAFLGDDGQIDVRTSGRHVRYI